MSGGSWSLFNSAGSISLTSDLSCDVTPIGCGLTPARRSHTLVNPTYPDSLPLQPRIFALRLTPNRRGAKDSSLRSSLLPYCRPEAREVQVRYTGAARYVSLHATYLDGLENLAPRFVAPVPIWEALFVTISTPASFVSQGTAAAYPSVIFNGGASGGTVSQLAISSDSGYSATLSTNITLAASGVAQIDVSPPPFLSNAALLDVSQVATFVIMPGETNYLSMMKTGTVAFGTCTYVPRYWSYEDADV